MPQAVTLTDINNIQVGVDGNPIAVSLPTVVCFSSGNTPGAQAQVSIPAVAGKTAYVTSIDFTSGGSTAAAVVNATLAGLVGGTTLQFAYGTLANNAADNKEFFRDFVNPIPANAPNTAIVWTVSSLGAGNLRAYANIYGFYK